MAIENIVFQLRQFRYSGFPTKINDLGDILISSRAKVLLSLALKRRTFILFRFVSIKDCGPLSYCDFNGSSKKKVRFLELIKIVIKKLYIRINIFSYDF